MKTYDDEILEEVLGLFEEMKDDFIKALVEGKDFDRDIDAIERFEEYVDPSFSSEDALIIMQECHEPADDDIGGSVDPGETLVYQAVRSYQNDVWFKAKELYEWMQDRVRELVDDSADNPDPGSLGDIEGQAVIQAFNEMIKENSPSPILPVEKDSPAEKQAIGNWLRLNRDADGFWGGYPVGSAYIDARCGSGHSMPHVKEFIDYDHEMRSLVPWLAGKRHEEVQARYDELLEDARSLDTPDWNIINQKKRGGLGLQDLKKQIIASIWVDKRLTVADIREIVATLRGRLGE